MYWNIKLRKKNYYIYYNSGHEHKYKFILVVNSLDNNTFNYTVLDINSSVQTTDSYLILYLICTSNM